MTIRILSWCGLIFGLTWIIALVLALIWHGSNWTDKGAKNTDLERLEKLSELHKKKIISDAEYKKLRKDLI